MAFNADAFILRRALLQVMPALATVAVLVKQIVRFLCIVCASSLGSCRGKSTSADVISSSRGGATSRSSLVDAGSSRWRVPTPIVYTAVSDPRGCTYLEIPASMSTAPIPSPDNPAVGVLHGYWWPDSSLSLSISYEPSKTEPRHTNAPTLPVGAHEVERIRSEAVCFLVDEYRKCEKTIRCKQARVHLSVSYNDGRISRAEIGSIIEHVFASFRVNTSRAKVSKD